MNIIILNNEYNWPNDEVLICSRLRCLFEHIMALKKWAPKTKNTWRKYA